MPNNNLQNSEPSVVKKPWIEKSIKEILIEIKDFFEDLIDIKEGMDENGTIQRILSNKRMKGANAVLLMCSIMVASLGLDLNSPAVIIGAMLISPLMSPILGVGLGVGINDKNTLIVSLQHFIISICIALLTSYIYFCLTPFGDLTPEIRSRTAPNLLDGLVAIFGGLAGVVSTTRKDHSNAVPGVAIATALMPPLCVAGYGLAEGNATIFSSAFYLFFLNSFFIATSTYVIIRILRFRYKQFPTKKERRRNQLVIFGFSFLMLFSAFKLLSSTISELREEEEIKKQVYNKFETSATAVTKLKVSNSDSLVFINIQLIGEPVKLDSLYAFDERLETQLGKQVTIRTYQSDEIPFADIQKLKTEVGGVQGEFAIIVNKMEKILLDREQRIDSLTQRLDSMQNEVKMTAVLEETRINYPLIQQIGFSKDFKLTTSENSTDLPVLMLQWDNRKKRSERKADEAKIQKFVQLRTNLDTLAVITY